VLVQLVLDPGEERSVTLRLPPGEYAAAAFGAAGTASVAVSPVGFARVGEIAVDARGVSARPAVFGDAGEIVVRFVNETDEERSVRIERRDARGDSVPATMALTHPTFRDFFAGELLSYGQLLGVSHLYFLAVDASDKGALFATRGDAQACALLRAFEESFERVVRDEGGSRLPGPLETMVAAFPSGSRALRAALDLLEECDADLPARAAIHGGRCLALTREARIEYFGETLHRALWLASASEPRGIVLSQTAASDRDIAATLHTSSVQTHIDVAAAGPYQGRRIMRVALREEANAIPHIA
jgi:class 3 adenylate cyclase